MRGRGRKQNRRDVCHRMHDHTLFELGLSFKSGPVNQIVVELQLFFRIGVHLVPQFPSDPFSPTIREPNFLIFLRDCSHAKTPGSTENLVDLDPVSLARPAHAVGLVACTGFVRPFHTFVAGPSP